MKQEFKNINKILVIKLRHIGDVLLSVPVFRALRENLPHAYIAALVNSGTEDVLTGNPLIDEIIIFDRNIKKMNPVQKYIKELSFLKNVRTKGFDMAVDLTSGDRAAIISLVSGAKYRLAYDPGKEGFWGKKYLYTHLVAQKDGSKHMVLQNLDVVRQFGIKTNNLTVDLFIPEDARVFVRKIFEKNNIPPHPPLTKGGQRGVKVVHVHPTTRWLFKCWKDEYMAGVISWLVEQGVKVIVTSSLDKREMDKAKRILSLVSEFRTPNSNPPIPPLLKGGEGGFNDSSPVTRHSSLLVDLCGKTTIKQLAAISEASDLFLGVDSAPMHIAAAVGTPVIALFGPTGEAQWGPWGDRHVVLNKIESCTDCKFDVCENAGVRKCLEIITVEEVITAITKILNG